MITFLPQNIKCEYQENQTILEAAAAAGVNIDGNCAGAGVCGKCKVKIKDGPMLEAAPHHYQLSDNDISAGFRLACCTPAKDEMVIEISESETTASRKKKLVTVPQGFEIDSNIKKYHINVKVPSIEHQKDDFSRIKDAMPIEVEEVNFCALKKFPTTLKDESTVTVTVRDNTIVDIEKGSCEEECYGVAVDIGTTTVVVIIWNLTLGEMIAINAVTNPQGSYGADVISRINFANSSSENLNIIHDAIINVINKQVTILCEEKGISKNNIYEYVVVGNTTMSHIFLGVNPAQLAVSPFTPAFTEGMHIEASKLGLVGNEGANVYLAANIAGHIGSDITAGIITTDIMKKDAGHLFIDIGTNGEIVLTGKGRTLGCSTAAGPAFEGSSIRQGMRASAGAIERVDISQQCVTIKTIGDVTPIGICGSGIIDAVAELIRIGVISKNGKVQSAEKLRAKGASEAILKNIRPNGKANDFVLYNSPDGKGDVLITQKDIREVQLAKAAISAGISIMMKELEMSVDEIEKVSIAGAFGSYIRNSSAIQVGLLPRVAEDKIQSLGNSAGVGASMMLMSKSSVLESEYDAKRIEHIELASRNDFSEAYMLAMAF